MNGGGGDDNPARTFQLRRLAVEGNAGMSLLYQQHLHEMVMAVSPDLPVMQRTSFGNRLDMRKAAGGDANTFAIERVAGDHCCHVPKVPCVCPEPAFRPIAGPVK